MKSIKGLSDRALLVIIDGYGINPDSSTNAVESANTPNIKRLFKHYPYTTIESGGLAVGLPEGTPGNSEVGHLNLGAGRRILQDLVKINECVAKGELLAQPKMQELVEKTKSGTGRVHIMGLLSDGGVHSHIDHIKNAIAGLSGEGLEVFYHAFMDGRDTPRDAGPKYVESMMNTEGFTFASMSGRAIAMDRDKRWEKTEHAFKTMTGEAEVTDLTPADYLKGEHSKKIYDEFVAPVLFDKNSAIKEGDSVFFMNFRPDRTIQMTMAMTMPDFEFFERSVMPGYFLCMTPYITDLIELPILFNKDNVEGGMSEYLSKLGKKQLKIAETEKYAHVTFFYNGGRKAEFEGEERVLVASPKEVETYDQKPEMSAFEVCDKLVDKLSDKSFTSYTVNFANPDMVGHTGNFEAAVKAVEAVDTCMGRLMEKCEQEGIAMLVTSDHGNSDMMAYENGEPHTSHTYSLVPFTVFHPELKDCQFAVAEGELALKDVCATKLSILDIEIPEIFEGKPIFK
ncbi:MAG: 2,3-bisphosphoglycerate-independent phosphoglycerate mutase [Bacteriovoracaceae bacterium]|nr:2,3-bisphosphoglycerate-independent phosphoglycerate mutase [Bacteriovoracaceae bacterium]